MPKVIQLTPPGRGAVATLRIEGTGAVEVVQRSFRAADGRALADPTANQLILGRFGGQAGEDVVVRRCGEDVVELHCHGGSAAVAAIQEALVVSGCRTTPWSDWVGAHESDPIAAAARVALADARTERTASILLDQYHGALRRAIDDIRRAIHDQRLEEARRQCDVLLARAELGRRLVKPWRVVLAGRPNVGKSSLVNSLAGFQRAIVHATPGTTRDVVSVRTVVDGWPVEVCDTAGLRPDCDAIERAGMELAHERLAAADLVVLVFDRASAWSAEDQTLVGRWPTAMILHNKCDLPKGLGTRPAGLEISALEGHGLPRLLEAITRRLVPDPPPPGAAMPFLAEQAETIRRLRATC